MSNRGLSQSELDKHLTRKEQDEIRRTLALGLAMDRYEGARKLARHFYDNNNKPTHFNALAENFNSRTTLTRGINALYQPGILEQVHQIIKVSTRPRTFSVLAYRFTQEYWQILQTYHKELGI